jgi:phosphatidylinositol alpha-1,6-mannosyltransferase
LNILIIGSDFKPLTGGIAEYTHQLALYLHESGDNVIVLSETTRNDQLFDKTCPYRVYRHNFRFLSKGKIRKYYAGYRWLREFVKQHHPIDIVISNRHAIASVTALAVAKSARIPYAIFTHGTEINRKEPKERLKILCVLNNARKVFSNSSFTRQLVKRYGVPANRTAVIPGGISIGDYRTHVSRKKPDHTANLALTGKKIIFTCGRLAERKGHDVVIKALPKIAHNVRNVVYVIAGKGPYEANLRKIVHELELEEYILFAGRVNDLTRQYLYRACSLFVMPCRELANGDVEGFGLVFLEANAYYKPVVAGRSGGVVDAVKHNETGILVNPLDVDQVADAIIYLLQHPNVALQMGHNGRRRIERELTWDISGAKLRRELNSILK